MTDLEGENVISSSVAVFSAGDFPQAAIIHSTKIYLVAFNQTEYI